MDIFIQRLTAGMLSFFAATNIRQLMSLSFARAAQLEAGEALGAATPCMPIRRHGRTGQDRAPTVRRANYSSGMVAVEEDRQCAIQSYML
jgi:hypothetical protein